MRKTQSGTCLALSASLTAGLQRSRAFYVLFFWASLFPPTVQSQDFVLPLHLFNLYQSYPSLHKQLTSYANTQGFTRPHENLSTVLHELIHIDSAAHNAYVILGQNYAPYNQPNAWPTYNFTQFRQTVFRSSNPILKQTSHNLVFNQYIVNAPQNTLANLADELNAYAQSAEWLCEDAPKNEHEKTLRSFRAMIQVADAFLLSMTIDAPVQYHAFLNKQHEARKLWEGVRRNAVEVLSRCSRTSTAFTPR